MIGTTKLEQDVLGALLLFPDRLDEIGDLTGSDFAQYEHEAAFDALSQLHEAGKRPSPTSVAARLPFDEIAGLSAVEYLTRLVAGGSLMDLDGNASTLVELARKRQLLTVADAIDAGARDGSATVGEVVQRAESMLYELHDRRGESGGWLTLQDASSRALELAAARFDAGGGLSGHSTGLSDLDRVMGGLQRSDLIIVAGRPAMGKTALATGIAEHLARKGIGSGFFSMEMSGEQLATRLMADQARVASSAIRRGRLSADEFESLRDAAREIGRLPIFIDQSGGLTIAQVTTRARRLKRQHDIGALFVDYLQLMSGSGRRGENRVNELAQITTGLKALAKELDVPVVALSQLSRAVETRDDKRPRLSDLRESGSIEQDADVVMFVYRDAYYLAQSKPTEGSEAFFDWQGKLEAAHGKAEIIIGKQRHGPTGTVDVHFDAEHTAFSDLARYDVLTPYNEPTTYSAYNGGTH